MSFICHIHNYTEYNEEWNVFSAFNPSKCTHTLGAVGLGLPRVSSPTLYPLGHDCPGLLNGNGGALNTLFWWRKWQLSYGSWEGHYLCSFWRIFGVWWNRYNTCLKRQNTLNVTVTALAVQNKREHPSRVKGFVETVVPNYCDICLAFQDENTFQAKDNPLLTSETVLLYILPYFYCEY